MKYIHKYTIDSSTGTETIINGKKYLYFGGTGYFQLNSHPAVLKAASDAIMKYGISSATSRAITGTTPLILELERKAAEYFDTEDAVYLPSGYLSNIAGMKALSEMNLYDIIFIDEGSHYSNMEGAQVIGKPIIKFKSRSIEDLQAKIAQYLQPNDKPLIASDGLFPIWAKFAPVDEYLKIAEKYKGIVWVDDAHSVGIQGKTGKGTYEYFGLKSERLYMGATLSKAFGAYGGIIPGNAKFIQKIKTGSVITGSSSPMYAAIAAGIKALEIITEQPGIRGRLWANARYLKGRIKSLGIKIDDNSLPIITFTLKSTNRMEKVHKALMNYGIYIQYAKYKGSGHDGVLRIVVFSTHTKNQIDHLVETLREVLLHDIPKN